MATVEIFLYLKIVNSIRIIALSSLFRLYVTFVTFLTKPLPSLREAGYFTVRLTVRKRGKKKIEEREKKKKESHNFSHCIPCPSDYGMVYMNMVDMDMVKINCVACLPCHIR